MKLYISTADSEKLLIELIYPLKDTVKVLISGRHRQAELLLPSIKRILTARGLNPADLNSIAVENAGSGFTSLRIGVATANALAYALNIPIEPLCGRALLKKGIRVVAPEYAAAPSITIKNS